MAKKTYWEKLQDPRWQKKRLEVMDRAAFSCEGCGNREKQLQIHHGYYERGLDPWEYDDDTLWCVCENCHVTAQDMLADIHKMIARFPPDPNMLEFLSKHIAIEHDRWMECLKNRNE